MRFLPLLFLIGCAPPEPVECSGVRPMVCECVTSCVSTSEQVIVTTDGTCEPTCWSPR